MEYDTYKKLFLFHTLYDRRGGEDRRMQTLQNILAYIYAALNAYTVYDNFILRGRCVEQLVASKVIYRFNPLRFYDAAHAVVERRVGFGKRKRERSARAYELIGTDGYGYNNFITYNFDVSFPA